MTNVRGDPPLLAAMPTVADQIRLLAEMQGRFRALLEERLAAGELAEALQLARWLSDSATRLARLCKEQAAAGEQELPAELAQLLALHPAPEEQAR